MRGLKFILAYTIGVIRDARLRRQFMFYGLVIAMLLLFVGATFLDGTLRQRVWIFFAYWFACAWLTLAALLLALYDMVAIRVSARRERRRLEREYLAQRPPDDEKPS